VGELALSDTIGTTRIGLTPHQFVLARRVEEACRLLAHSAIPIGEVARRCGFSQPGTPDPGHPGADPDDTRHHPAGGVDRSFCAIRRAVICRITTT
jgi:hypothetical protein